MKQFRSRAIVQAARVVKVVRDRNAVQVELEGSNALVAIMGQPMHGAVVGCYLVRYADGLMSTVPADKFETLFEEI